MLAHPHSARKKDRTLQWVFATALLIRLLHVLCLQVAPFGEYLIGDAARYDAWAREIAAGDWLGSEVFYQAPLYPYWLAIVYATLGDSLLLVRLLQALLGATSCALVAAAGTRLFGGRAGFWAGLALAVYAPAIFMEGLIQKSALDLFFVSLMAWLFSRLVERDRWADWGWLGLVTAALCLTRENALLLVPLIVSWIALATDRAAGAERRLLPKFQRLVGFGSGLALLLLPVAARNATVGGEWHLTTSQWGPNFFIGNREGASGTYEPLRTGRGDAKFEALDARQLAETGAGRPLSAAEVSRYYAAQSWLFIRQQPGAWLQLEARKLGLALNRNELVDTEDQYTVARWSPVLWVADWVGNFGLLLPLVLLGIWRSRRQWRQLWWAYAMIGAMLGTMVVFFVFSRYRLPIVPLMALFAGLPLADAQVELRRVWSHTARTASHAYSRRAQAVLALMLFAVVIASHWPLVDRAAAQAVTLANYGSQALHRGRLDQAESFLTRAVALKPRFVEAQNNLGVLYRMQNNPAAAARCFQRALELAPDYATARENLESLNRDRLQPAANSEAAVQ